MPGHFKKADMATKPKQATKARALADMDHLGVVNGDLIEGDSALIDSLAQCGKADPHPDAVAYAESVGARVQVVAAE